MPPDKKVLIFDDWHHGKVTHTQRMGIVESAKRIFGHVVIIAGDILRFEEIAGKKGDSNQFPGSKGMIMILDSLIIVSAAV